MRADDKRHGTYAGYIDGCRDECCRKAARDYQRQRYFDHAVLGLPPRHVDKTGSVRRIHALQALGWSAEYLSQQLGRSRAYLNVALNRHGRRGIHRNTADAIEELYSTYSMRLGPSEHTRRRAAERGWPAPLAWDDDAIDDPNATPHVGTKKRNPHHEQTDERHATFADLDTWGYGISEACRRLNTSRDALEAWSYRHGEADVYQRLVERENYAEKVNGATVERRVS